MKTRRSIVVILLIVVSLLFLGLYFFGKKSERTNSKLNSNASPSKINIDKDGGQRRTYVSSNLDFKVQIPANFTTKEGLTYVDFSLDKSMIGTARTANSYDNLDKFLVFMDEKNDQTNVPLIKKIDTSSYPIVVREEIRSGTVYRMYYVFTGQWVYTFSTSSENLYDDLDQIVQTFQYTPN